MVKTSLKKSVRDGKSLAPLYSTGENEFLWKYRSVGYPTINKVKKHILNNEYTQKVPVPYTFYNNIYL